MRTYEAQELAHQKRWTELKAYAESNPLSTKERAEEVGPGILPGKRYGLALILAVQDGSPAATEAALALIQAGANLHYYLYRERVRKECGDILHDSTLHLAARQGNRDIVRALLAAGCPITLYNSNQSLDNSETGETPIITAARAGKWDIVKLFAEMRPLSKKELADEINPAQSYGAKYGFALVMAVAADSSPEATRAALALLEHHPSLASLWFYTTPEPEKLCAYPLGFALARGNITLIDALLRALSTASLFDHPGHRAALKPFEAAERCGQTAAIQHALGILIPIPSSFIKAKLREAFRRLEPRAQAEIISSWRGAPDLTRAQAFIDATIETESAALAVGFSAYGLQPAALAVYLKAHVKANEGDLNPLFDIEAIQRRIARYKLLNIGQLAEPLLTKFRALVDAYEARVTTFTSPAEFEMLDFYSLEAAHNHLAMYAAKWVQIPESLFRDATTPSALYDTIVKINGLNKIYARLLTQLSAVAISEFPRTLAEFEIFRASLLLELRAELETVATREMLHVVEDKVTDFVSFDTRLKELLAQDLHPTVVASLRAALGSLEFVPGNFAASLASFERIITQFETQHSQYQTKIAALTTKLSVVEAYSFPSNPHLETLKTRMAESIAFLKTSLASADLATLEAVDSALDELSRLQSLISEKLSGVSFSLALDTKKINETLISEWVALDRYFMATKENLEKLTTHYPDFASYRNESIIKLFIFRQLQCEQLLTECDPKVTQTADSIRLLATRAQRLVLLDTQLDYYLSHLAHKEDENLPPFLNTILSKLSEAYTCVFLEDSAAFDALITEIEATKNVALETAYAAFIKPRDLNLNCSALATLHETAMKLRAAAYTRLQALALTASTAEQLAALQAQLAAFNEADGDLELIIQHSKKPSKEITVEFLQEMLADVSRRYAALGKGESITVSVKCLMLRAAVTPSSTSVKVGLFSLTAAGGASAAASAGRAAAHTGAHADEAAAGAGAAASRSSSQPSLFARAFGYR